MSGAILDRHHGPFSPGASQTEAPPVVSLLVHLRHDAQNCTATFIGALTAATPSHDRRRCRPDRGGAVGGPRPLEVEVVDQSGADAVAMMVNSVRARGGHFRIVETNRPSAAAVVVG